MTEPAELLRNSLARLAPLERWSRGAVTLVGDAAHAMAPNLGQGAAQALEPGDGVRAADGAGAGDWAADRGVKLTVR